MTRATTIGSIRVCVCVCSTSVVSVHSIIIDIHTLTCTQWLIQICDLRSYLSQSMFNCCAICKSCARAMRIARNYRAHSTVNLADVNDINVGLT